MTKVSVRSFDDGLLDALRNPEFAQAYLQVALEDSISEFLVALRKYVRANGGMKACAERAGIAREALYRILSEEGNPELRSLEAILSALGIKLSVRLIASADTQQVALAE